MDETVGPYHAGVFPADMIAMLSPMTVPSYAQEWRARQAGNDSMTLRNADDDSPVNVHVLPDGTLAICNHAYPV